MRKRPDHWGFWLVLSFIGAVLPHLGHLPWWSILYFSGALAFFAFSTGLKRGKKGKWIIRFLTLVLFLLTVVSFRGTIGRDAGTAMLVGLMGLKLLELGTLRDRKLFCLLNYFLILTTVLYFQSLAAALYMLLTAFINSLALVRTVRDRPGWLADTRRVALILVQSLPLAVLLFVFFPRIPGSLFGLQQVSGLGVSGMSDFLAPGEISSLVMSEKPVFRVSFSGKPPEPAQRYWRCMVFGDFDGVVWKAFRSCPGPEKVSAGGKSFSYELTLEGHNGLWVPVLGVPVEWPGSVRPECSGLLQFRRRLTRRKRISLVSKVNTSLEGENRERYLELPRGVSPRARELGEEWRDLPEKKRVSRGLDFFRENEFVYTLHPGVMHGDYIDRFLFRERKGFCEHYAAAFAFLMRAANLPSRVVVGYQGGETNPLGDYMLIREQDAHAWVEVYLKDTGWKRVDPVAMVSPTRVEQGFSSVQSGEGNRGAARLDTDGTLDWLQDVFWAWDTVNNAWNQWVLDYTYRTQGRLLARLKLDSLNLVGILKVIVGSVAGLLFLYGLFRVYLRVLVRKKSDPVAGEYTRFCRKMSRAGIERPDYMGPLDYQEMIEAEYGRSREVENILDMYIRLRYLGHDPGLVSDFRRAVRGFDPKSVFRKNRSDDDFGGGRGNRSQ
jgi:transglutaminase-like putative cysteine protease